MSLLDDARKLRTAILLLREFKLITIAQKDALIIKLKTGYNTRLKARKTVLQGKISDPPTIEYPVGATNDVKSAIDLYNEPIIADAVMGQFEIDEINLELNE